MRIPNDWTMEDAATCFVVYATVYQILVKNSNLKPGQSILIHSGTGGIGLAAINLCLHFGLKIFVTVGTQEKRDFLKQNYPQIKVEHIGNSRDTSNKIRRYGAQIYGEIGRFAQVPGQRGPEFVEEKLVASLRCLARGGKFLEIGKFDLASNNILVLKLLGKDAQFRALALDRFVFHGNYGMQCYIDEIQELINCGAIKPLPRTVFNSDEVEKAFRYLGTGKHIGKVLIKIREEEPDEIHPVPQTSFTAYPRFLCKPDSSYLICGGLGGFGLELADLLVVRGAKKLILTSRSGLRNGYQKFESVITTKGDATTEESCSDLLNVAQKLGPLDGIFNLAAVLKDAAFENLTVEDFKVPLVPKAVCTRNLDKFSRELCPNLRYFVVFSSISCGRGNIGQTNYGMANSIMERICENRKKDGYPALAIQWGANGEVGLVAKMQEDHRELVISGTLQQRISSCLQVLDNFLTQDEPIVASMLVAEKRYGGHANNLFDAVLNIMGVTNLKSVSMHATFPELGMDSMTAVEIKQTMEREYELFLTAQDIRGMTLSKLRDIANAQQPAAEVFAGKKDDIPMEIKLLLSYMSKGELLTKPLTEMETSVEASDEAAPHVFVIPGFDGTAAMLEQLCRKLKAHATCLSYPIDARIENINEISEAMLPYIESYPGDLIILAYSYGTAVATELMHMLEAKGRTAKIIFVDGSSEFVYGMLKVYFPTEDDRLFQILLLSVLMSRYMRYEEILKHQEIMMKLDSYPRRIEYFINISSRAETSTNYVTEMCLSAYDRLKALSKYKLRTEKLKSPVTLLKANMTSFTKTAADYGLSNVCRDPVKVVTIEGDHASILETDELAEQINWCLEDRAKSG
ncbi:KR domain [Popillia japonica]|uniref:oleoyl-[acyl-carrier-protein] hydrolase n=1 Tax=Popillia japonica TaxID=7064 RepID=A0AAW1MKC6_POPJA